MCLTKGTTKRFISISKHYINDKLHYANTTGQRIKTIYGDMVAQDVGGNIL